MTATQASPRTTTCPSWCDLNSDEHQVETDDLGTCVYHHGSFASGHGWSTRINGATDELGVPDPGGEPAVVVDVDGDLSPAGARSLAAALLRAADRLTPADAKAVAVLEMTLGVINELRGTDHTLESVARRCGVEYPGGATMGDVTRMSRLVADMMTREA